MENNHVVYMIRCKDNTLYTGYTNDLEKRLQKHETGKGAKYTRGRGPFVIEYQAIYETREEALKVEYQIKKLSRKRKEGLIALQKEGFESE